MIGAALRRLEDPRLITGRGRYVDDVSRPGALHAVFVRSPEAHAVITGVDFRPAPGSTARMFLAEDLGIAREMPVQNPSPALEVPVTQAPLAVGEVCYVGQPVAVVVAGSAAEAVDASEAVLVDYRTLPVCGEHRTALLDDAPPVHEGAASNRAATLRARLGASFSDVERSFHVLELEFDQHRGAVASMEGRGVLAEWDDVAERLHVWTSSQSPHAVRQMVSQMLDLSPALVRVTTPDVGGGFGPKAVVHPEEVVVAALSRSLQRPVKWVERRREHFTSTIQQRGQSASVRVAYSDTGRVQAIEARLIHDLGAFSPYGVVVPMTTLRLMSGPYMIANLDVEIECVYTNKTPTGAIRGAGRPNAIFILERVMDAIAAALSLDRAEVRRRNFIPSHRFPYSVAITASDGRPVTYDGGDYAAALESALAAADLDGFPSRRDSSAARGLLLGFGIASYVEDTGVGPYDGARVEILPNGEVTVEVGVSSQGQGHATVFAQICADRLGVDPERVRVVGGDTDRYQQGVPTVASRTGQTTASAVSTTAAELADTVKRMVAHRLEAAVEDITLTGGVAMVVGQPGSEIELGALAAGAQSTFGGSLPEGQTRPGLAAEQVLRYGGSAFTYGTHVAEVAIDPETGHVGVLRYVVVHDCGTLLNPMIVDGQIDGGVAHGLGNALSERIVHDDNGQPLTTSFMDYRLVAAAEMPELVKLHTETPSPTNPLGAKGAGEGGTIPAAAAVVSAVEHAIGLDPGRITHYPLSSQWVRSVIAREELVTQRGSRRDRAQ
ncbi:MAG TPA: xanthine dehydrogenase family protein molybdopterin-binding subunit [Acidimicrobiia bacterium]|nr:xanthine dehydrogenase family protein molybdopterin-binding subunit [Acidimicrobiia bacterium]